MKTIEITLYSFSELSEEAKKRAVENHAINAQFMGGDEAIETIEKIAEYFGSKLTRYEIDWTGCCSYSSALFDTDGIELSEKELKKLIKGMGSYNKETLKGNGDCKFTGVCYDEDFADGARKAFFDGERDLSKILEAGFRSLLKSCANEYEHELSEEAYSEQCEANETQFTKSGNIYYTR